jgi:Uma2 family endonuclease
MSIPMHELPRRHRITVENLYRMAEAGVFAADERVELVDGEIIDVPPMGHRHAGIVEYLMRLLMDSITSRAIMRPLLPVRLGEDSEPVPDIAVVKLRDDRYMGAHPRASDVVLIIEVSSTTLRFDRNVKVPMYARHGVAEVWVLDVNNEQLHYYRSPEHGRYTATGSVPLTGPLPIAALGIEVDLTPLAAALAASAASQNGSNMEP